MARPPSMRRAVDAALREAAPSALDVAAVALARRYAQALDDAAKVAEAAASLVVPDDAELNDRRAWEALRRRVDEQAAVAQLGPRLLAVLEALGLTPAARQATPKGGAVVGQQPGAVDALTRLRERRASARAR